MSENRSGQLSAEERARRIAYRKKRKILVPVSRAMFLIVFILSAILLITLIKFGFIPKLWIILIAAALGIVNLILGLLAFIRKVPNNKKIGQIVVCVLMSALLMFGNITLPKIKGSIERMFTTIPEEGEMYINVYTLADKNYASIEDLAGKRVGVLTKMDEEYQEFAVKVVNKEIEGQDIVTVSAENIYDSVDQLYAGNVEAIILNETYAEIISDNSDYTDFTDKTSVLYQCMKIVKYDNVDADKVKNFATTPFVIAILGNDTWHEVNTNPKNFRTDVNMLAVVNPVTHKVLIITLPRDSYVGLNGDASKMDKLTHDTYFFGIDGWIKTITSLLNVNINYYVKINFTSLIKAVDAVGGIDINNPYEFTTTYVSYEKGKSSEVTFKEGNIHLVGAEALGYVRERKHLKNGDMDRNMHQALVLKALVNKVCTPAIIGNATDLLKAMDKAFLTNMETKELFSLVQMQLEYMGDWDIEMYGITGTSKMAPSYAMGGTGNLSMVILNDSKVAEAKAMIKAAMQTNQ